MKTMQTRFISVLIACLIFCGIGLHAQTAEEYKKAAGIAAEILSDYLKNPTKMIESGDISVNHQILYQQGQPGVGARISCNMYLTFYDRSPHPHQANFKHIQSLPDAWKFKPEYGQHVCERQFAGKSNELIRIKSHYSLPSANSKVKTLSTMAFVDFYAGSDRKGYFSFSLNRTIPVSGESSAQLESKGHSLAISDSEKIIEAIRAGLAGKSTVIEDKESAHTNTNSDKWLALSPADIVKTHQHLINKPVTSPILFNIGNFADLSRAKVCEELNLERLKCLTMTETLYSFSQHNSGNSQILFVAVSDGLALVYIQLADGSLAFSPAKSFTEAVAEAAELLGPGLKNHWLAFSQKISAPELMVLKSLSTLSAVDHGKPRLPGFSIGQILLEMGNPVHVSSIGLMPESSKNKMFGATLNRNDVAVALLTMESQNLIKRSYLGGQHYFALTGKGLELTDIFAAENIVTTISVFKNLRQQPNLEQIGKHGKLVIFSDPEKSLPVFLSRSGDLFSGFPATSTKLESAPDFALKKLINKWF